MSSNCPNRIWVARDADCHTGSEVQEHLVFACVTTEPNDPDRNRRGGANITRKTSLGPNSISMPRRHWRGNNSASTRRNHAPLNCPVLADISMDACNSSQVPISTMCSRRAGRAPPVCEGDQSRANAANCFAIGASFHARIGSANVRFRPSTSHASSGDPIS